MKDLNLQFRPVAEFLLDFIHKSPSFSLEFVGDKDGFKLYKYKCEFILARMLFTLYRVTLVDVDIFVNFDSSYTELRLLFDVHAGFPHTRVECTISDCNVFNLKCHYINSDNNE